MKKLLSLLSILLVWCSSIAIGANPITLPFEMNFLNNQSVAPNTGYMIRDWAASNTTSSSNIANGGLWAGYNNYYGKQGEVCAHSTATANTWLISPSLPLEVGKGYKITYTVKRYVGNTEKLNIGLAGATSIEAIKEGTILYEDHEITNDDWETRTIIFRSDVGGTNCCIGFHCISEPLPSNPTTITFVGLGNFKIEEYDMPDPVVPQPVTDFTVKPSEERPLTAVLSWTNPTKGTLDESLNPTETLTAKIYRNSEEVAIVKDLVAGEAVSYEDTPTEEGDYTYGISIGLTGTYGETVTASQACSLVKFYPEKITDGSVTSQELNVTLRWTNPSKFTDGKDIKDKISVDIYRNNVLLTTVTDQTPGASGTYTDKVPQADTYTYSLKAKSIEGTEGAISETISAGYVTGAISLPYNALTAEFLNWTYTDENHDNITWNLSVHKDNFSCQCVENGHDILKSPLLKANAGNYKIALTIKRIDTPVDFTINRISENGTITELLKETGYTAEAKGTLYAELSFEAESKFYISVDLKATATGGSFVIDNITIKDRIVPKTVTELTVTPDAKKQPKAVISWKNPETGINDEILDNLLSAEIYRNDILVKTLAELETGAACTYTDEISEPAVCTYAVRIGFEGTYGEKVTSDEYEVGKVYHQLILPYSIDFTTNAPEGTTDDVNTSHVYYNGTWTIINPAGNLGLGNGGVWSERSEEGIGAVCHHHSNPPANAWIVSPALPLSKDKAYSITYSYKRIPNSLDGTYIDENFEIGLGTDATADALKRRILSTQSVTNNEFITVTKKFTVSEDGDYYLGFHCNSETGYSQGATGLAIGSFKTEETTIVKPAEITGFTATADATKELTADLAWTNPSQGEGGKPLSEDADLTVELYRNGTLVETLTVEPGSNSTWSETVEKAGSYTYIVKAGQYGVYTAGVSATCQLENFVPQKVTDLAYIIEDETNIVLSWTAPVTYTNNISMTGDLTIEIYRDNNLIESKNSEAGAKEQYKDELVDFGTYSYYVKVKLPNGVSSEKSADVQVTTTSAIDEVNASKGYYDRKAGIFHLAVPSSGLAVYSLTGMCILKEMNETDFIDLNSLPDGTYLLQINGSIIKIVK